MKYQECGSSKNTSPVMSKKVSGTMFSKAAKALFAGSLAIAISVGFSTQKASAQFWGWGSSSNVEGRHMVSFKSKHRPGTVIVSFGDRRLYLVRPGNKAISYPIAIPKKEAKWQGNFRISSKRVNPTWTPTADMRRENPKLPAVVRGGDPRNPLGVRALYVGNTLYRIHGTDAPWLIGEAVSHGCVRMFNKDVIDLYNRVPVGSKVIVTWNKYKVRNVGYSGYGKKRKANFNPFGNFGF
jgi:lipoprotein-anchoring transpeptidase ErfK/SrfK